MFVVQLRFAENKALAGQFMEGHKAWIQQGFDDGIFLLVGNLSPNLGGAVLAHGIDRDALSARVDQDPFVAESVVTADIVEITPNRADDRLGFLLS